MAADLDVRCDDGEPASATPAGDDDGELEPAGSLNNPVADAERAQAADADERSTAPADDAPSVHEADARRLASEVSDLSRELESATRRADELAAIARRQSEMVDELHRENRTLRAGEIREAVAPLVRGLARLSDDLARMRLGAGAESADLSFLDARVAELLHDCGVLPERPEPGAAFDPQVHQATGSATTDEPSADRTIAELRRVGLRRDDGRVLRPADVVVYRYVAAAARPPTEPRVAAAAEQDAGGCVDTATEGEVA